MTLVDSDGNPCKPEVGEASLNLLVVLRKAGSKAFKPLGFTYLEAMALIFIERGHTQSKDLGQLLGVVLPSISAMTAKMVDSGFLIKAVLREDNRVVLLSLTDEGKEVCQKLRAAWESCSPVDTSAFTDEEISAFIRVGRSLVR